MLTPYEQLVEAVLDTGYNLQEHFIKNLWNPLWTTKNRTTVGPPGPR